MKTRLFNIFSFTALIFFISSSFAFAQITSSSASGRNSGKTDEAIQAEARINQIKSDAGRYFKQALLNLQDNRRPQAGKDFNKSIEVFLISGVNVQSNKKLSECYTQLIETIYRVEFPANMPPQIRSLSATCGWDVSNELADNIAKIVINQPILPSETTTAQADREQVPNEMLVGFSEQVFEASPLDELSKLQLTQEEEDIYTPEAQTQIKYIQYAVANKSFGFSFEFNPMIQQFINYYRGRGRKTMEVGLYRSGMFMTMARQIFKEEGVPEYIAWLGQVESAWKPTAHSWAAAAGLWQFIPGTGARYGLRRTAYLDERQSFEQATRASAKYLKFLANRYNGNWELAMAGYNCGEGNVDKAIRRAGVANFWKAYPYLPRETRNYVPNILATILIASNPHQYGFGHVRPAPSLRYDRIRMPASTNLNVIAQASDTTVEYLRYLNPELRTNMTPPEPYIVRVPAGKANEVVAVFRNISPSQRNTAGVSNTVRGETWETLARKTGVSVGDLKAANGNAPYPRGKVFVPNGNGVANTNYSRPTSPIPSGEQTSGVKIVKANSGDTVKSVAERYDQSPVEVAKLNGLYINSKLNAGREIKIPSN